MSSYRPPDSVETRPGVFIPRKNLPGQRTTSVLANKLNDTAIRLNGTPTEHFFNGPPTLACAAAISYVIARSQGEGFAGVYQGGGQYLNNGYQLEANLKKTGKVKSFKLADNKFGSANLKPGDIIAATRHGHRGEHMFICTDTNGNDVIDSSDGVMCNLGSYKKEFGVYGNVGRLANEFHGFTVIRPT